jgi:hypothetical protein
MSAILENKLKEAILACTVHKDPVLKEQARERMLELQEQLDMLLVEEDAQRIKAEQTAREERIRAEQTAREERIRAEQTCYSEQLNRLCAEMINDDSVWLNNQKTIWNQTTLLAYLNKRLVCNLKQFREPANILDYKTMAMIANYGIKRRIILVNIDGNIIEQIGKEKDFICVYVWQENFVDKN